MVADECSTLVSLPFHIQLLKAIFQGGSPLLESNFFLKVASIFDSSID
jgi:hypothetical protein